MKNKIYLLIIILICLSQNISAQQLSLQWSRQFGQGGWDYVNCLIPDSSGNFILGGSLKGILSSDSTHPELSYSNNAFLASCDTNGKILWQKTFGGKMFDNVTSVAQISQGLIISGIFQDTIRFDSLFAVTTAFTGAFITLADDLGIPVWMKSIGGQAIVSDLLLSSDTQDKLFLAGTFSDSLQLAGQEKAIHGENGFFLETLLPDGSETFPVVLKTKGIFSLGGICSNDTLVCMAGSFSDTLRVNDTMFFSSGAEDVFIAMFTPEGDLKQMITAGGIGIDQVRSVTFSPDGDICITGSFDFAFLMDNQILKSNGGKDIFIAVLNPAGNLKWLRSIGGLGNDYGYTITTNINNDIFVSGNFVRNIQMPDENGNVIEMDAGSAFGNAFIAKYNSNGDLKASYNLSATSEDYCRALIAGNNGMITAAGNFYQSIILQNDNILADTLVSYGERDIFLLRFVDMCKDVAVDAGADTSLCPNQTIVLTTPGIYQYYRWIPGGKPNHFLQVTQPGTYNLLVTDVHGCIASDSIRVLKNQIPLVYAGNDTIIAAGETLQLIHAASSNTSEIEWTSQGSGYFDNPGHLASEYFPSFDDISKGTVLLTLSSTNFCGISNSSLLLSIKRDEDGITVFPNPTHNSVSLVCTEGITIHSASITMQSGNMVVPNFTVNSAVLEYNLSAYPPGSFLFHLNTGTTTITKLVNKL